MRAKKNKKKVLFHRHERHIVYEEFPERNIMVISRAGETKGLVCTPPPFVSTTVHIRGDFPSTCRRRALHDNTRANDDDHHSIRRTWFDIENRVHDNFVTTANETVLPS